MTEEVVGISYGTIGAAPGPEGIPPDATKFTVAGDKYTTKGQTKVATPMGRAFRSANEDLPLITAAGVYMTADEANEVIAEAGYENTAVDGLVFKVEKNEEA